MSRPADGPARGEGCESPPALPPSAQCPRAGLKHGPHVSTIPGPGRPDTGAPALLWGPGILRSTWRGSHYPDVLAGVRATNPRTASVVGARHTNSGPPHLQLGDCPHFIIAMVISSGPSGLGHRPVITVMGSHLHPL